MAGLNYKVVFSLYMLLQVIPSEVNGWARTQPWSFKNEGDCLRYYANMTYEESSVCPTMWDGVLCWPPSPYHVVALLPCPRSPEGTERARTAYKLCKPGGRWEDIENPTSTTPSRFSPSPASLHSSRSESESSSSLASHPCVAPRDEDSQDALMNKGVITSYHVSSRIQQRYAQTLVTVKILNTDTKPSQQRFRMTLPEEAFISSLVMEIDGTNFTSNVRKKSVASRSYLVSKEKVKDAALLEQSGMQEFVVNANIVSRQVTFYIKYEELLRRVNGQYMQKIFIRPGMRIPEAEVDIHILEHEPIGDYRILELPGQEQLGNPGARVNEILLNEGNVLVNYKHVSPPSGSGRGVDGTFTIAYNLRNQNNGGKVQHVGNYFNHFISLDASRGIPKLATHTVFALDVSNSMGSAKLSQMKEAMKAVIKSMAASDSFEILAFSSDVASLGIFNGTHYRKALRRVKKLQPMSYSNLNSAYLEALKSVNEYSSNLSPLVKQVVMVTDGHPTQGVLDPMEIRRNVLGANTNKVPIFGIGFGQGTYFNLIQQISTDSQAFARLLINKETLSKDLQAYFKEISKPLLTNFLISYPEDEVDRGSVVKMTNSVFYSGGEVIVVGRLYPGVRNLHPEVTGQSQNGRLELPTIHRESSDAPVSISQRDSSPVIRLWAYLTIKHWLKEAEMSDNYVQVQRLLDQATHLALQFRFVTHVTSLVVRDATGEYETDFSLENSLHVPVPRGPNEIQQPLAPRSLRKNRIVPQGIVDMDPHFLVKSPSLELPLCFDYHATNGAYISLIRDLDTGIIVNGQTMSAPSKPKLTYITKLFIATGKVNITITPECMEVDCVDDDGRLKVDHVTKSLWPFYKKNGKKYKKRMANNHVRKEESEHVSLQDNQSSAGAPVAQRLQQHKESPREQTSKNYPLIRRLFMGLFSKGRFEQNSSVKRSPSDVSRREPKQLSNHRTPPRHHHGHDRPKHGSRISRQSEVGSAGRTRDKPVPVQNDHGLCDFNSSWKDGAGKKYGDVMVVLNKKRNMHIMVGDGLAHFIVVLSRKDNYDFLGFYLEDEEILSPRTHGLIGQFKSKNITSSTPTRTAEEELMVELSVQRRTTKKRYRVSQVTGYMSKHRSSLVREHMKCIEVRRQSKKLLDGKPRDYHLECLQC